VVEFQRFEIGKNYRLPCPACGRGPKDTALSVKVDSEGGVARCFRCHSVWKSSHPNVRRNGEARRPRLAHGKRETLSDYWRELWSACCPIGGIARDYLKARRCQLPPEDGDLRFHAALKHPSKYVGPALVALVTDVLTREPISLHRTWICADGTKAGVDSPRLLLGEHRKQGGVIRLWPDDAVTTGLLVGEGIETVLSAARHYRPVWSTIDAGNLASLPVLSGIETLLIAADHDDAGLKAANQCAERWATAGVDVHCIAPAREHADWNDVERMSA